MPAITFDSSPIPLWSAAKGARPLGARMRILGHEIVFVQRMPIRGENRVWQQSRSQSPRAFWSAPTHGALE